MNPLLNKQTACFEVTDEQRSIEICVRHYAIAHFVQQKFITPASKHRCIIAVTCVQTHTRSDAYKVAAAYQVCMLYLCVTLRGVIRC